MDSHNWANHQGAGGPPASVVATASAPPPPPEQRFFIDGRQQRLTSALQVVTEALAASTSLHPVPVAAAPPTMEDEEPDRPVSPPLLPPPLPSASTALGYGGKTVVASDNDVSNGFVKSGQSLPYVFEANESGVRKRSSKILPVCAVCGKRFVCVTTMKRHLVTHTGEKPFSCKVCGKQYTQKGNLRVHERTHRNDRPFECNICHQKFYRKEPMQKHQWRQHGIVHFKSRPPGCITPQTPQHTSNTTGPVLTLAPPPSAPAAPAAVVAASVTRPPINVEPPRPLIPIRPASATSYTALVDSIKASARDSYPEMVEGRQRPPAPPPPITAPAIIHLQQQHHHIKQTIIEPPTAHQPHIDHVPKFSQPPPPPFVVAASSEAAASDLLGGGARLEFKHAKLSISNNNSLNSSSCNTSTSSPYSSSPPSPRCLANGGASDLVIVASTRPLIEEATEEVTTADESSNQSFTYSSPPSSLTNLHPRGGGSTNRDDASPARQAAPNSHLLMPPVEAAAVATTSPSGSGGGFQQQQQQQQQQQHPLKLKMKLARAYQKEVEEAEQQKEATVVAGRVANLDNDLLGMRLAQSSSPNSDYSAGSCSEAKEMVECQCKTCGNTFSVVDPYNFRCTNCHVKYTSLPTHLIADPLQCIGCCAIFPHKPALKAHQTVPDKERPFRCCKCGYGFRQKAHLQKHQWRIHRRKLEPDPGVKEAEAFFEVIRSSTALTVRDPAVGPTLSATNGEGQVATITMQDIINHGVEKSIGEPRFKQLMKTSSKYYSEVLGLEYDPNTSKEVILDEDESSSSATQSTSASPSSSPRARNDQPLDLSPAKKQNPSSLLETPASVDLKIRDLVASLPFNNSNKFSRGESNALLNQPPLPSSNPASSPDYPVWKKQKTSAAAAAAATVVTHTTLPPISGLQKPMSLVVNPSRKEANYKHSSWISNSNNNSASSSHGNDDSKPPGKPDQFRMRNQLDLLRNHNARTV